MKNIKNLSQDGVKLVLKSGTKITPSTGTQATHIADLTTAGSNVSAAGILQINAILTALENVGIIASS